MRQRCVALAFASILLLATSVAAFAASPSSSPRYASPTGSSIVSSALSYVGYSYAYYGDTPSTGFSCTGFVHWIYGMYGYNTSEDVATLYYSYPHVDASNLAPGDVLIFANTFHPGFSHAAIYIGNGQMIGADNYSVGVHIDYLWDSYWGPRFVGAVRVLPLAGPAVSVAGFSYRKSTTSQQVTVAIAALRVRSNPSWTAGTLRVVHYGDHLGVIGHDGSWLHVRTSDGISGWVSHIYVSS